jgi:amidophosphoribosyltransferase
LWEETTLFNSCDDRLREECGVFGIFGIDEAAVLTTLGLHSLQHRGQEGAGIVSVDGDTFHAVKHPGLVGDHFNTAETLAQLPGRKAIGHVRYSTTGGTNRINIQPLFANLASGGFACAHNGNLTNTAELTQQLIETGSIFQTTSDTEIILQLVARSRQAKLVDKLQDALTQVAGAYALIFMTAKKMIGVKDPYGIRPLVIGKKNGAYVLASETCALVSIGATYVRDVKNGEMVVITDAGLQSVSLATPPVPERPCVFERIYFARPDSMVAGKSVYSYRKELGVQLAIENDIDADVIVPILDSGAPAALGFSQASGIPFEYGIIRNHYVGRTFIEPSQSIRQFGVKLKHSVNASCIRGKTVVLIDDSIVRGTTASKVVKMVFDAGAKAVHFGISSPPIKFPDFYGIDTPNHQELIAATNDINQITQIIGATSVFFLSLDGLYRAMGFESRDDACPQLTDHCFTGDYPIPAPHVIQTA